MFSLRLSVRDEPVGNATVCSLYISKFLEVGEDSLSFFLLGSFACVLEIVYGINFSHC